MKPMLHKSIIQNMAKLSHSAIDISDGLAADLNHILEASNVGATILLSDIPINPWIKKNQLFDLALSGGDDYQLLFTAPERNRDKIHFLNKTPSIKLTRIGKINKEKNLKIIDQNGKLYKTNKKGFDHFGTK